MEISTSRITGSSNVRITVEGEIPDSGKEVGKGFEEHERREYTCERSVVITGGKGTLRDSNIETGLGRIESSSMAVSIVASVEGGGHVKNGTVSKKVTSKE